MKKTMRVLYAALGLALLVLAGPASAALQFGATARTNEASAFQTTLGSAAGNLVIYSGTAPASCGATEAGSVLATIPLPTTAFTASAGAATQAGTWSANASASGTASHFEIQTSAGSCVVLGNVTTDLVLQNTSIATGQTISISSFVITEGNQ